MPAQEQAFRRQKATLLPIVVDGNGRPVSDRFGQPTFNGAGLVNVMVKWSDKKARKQDKDGNSLLLDATAVVDRVVVPGSLIWKGWDAGTTTTAEVHVVKTYDEVWDMKGRFSTKTVGLMRFRDTVPDSGRG